MNQTLLFLAFSGVFILLNLYISRRLIQKLDIKQKYKTYLRIFLVVNFLGILGYTLGRNYIEFANWIYFLFSIPIGILFLLFCTAVIYDVLRIFLHHTPISENRRVFFKKALDTSSLLIASSLSAKSMYNAQNVEIEKVNIKINKLKKAYKIVQLSDIHIGGLIDKRFISDVVQKVNNLNPDLVVITGDLVDIDISHAQEALNELKNLNSKYGTYFVVGNHEYFHNVTAIIKSVKSLGIRVLENENIYIGDDGEGFNLAGVYDIFGYRTNTYMPEITDALKNLKDSPTVLLAHQPRYVDEVTHNVDLMLSGHTHGGQLYPFKLLVKLQQPYISGLHQHNKKLQIYVNKGTGFWGPPMRLGASSEITDIILQPIS